MKFQPYPFQEVAIRDAVEFLRSNGPGARRLYAAPTGCGKSVVELLTMEALGDGCWIVSPRDEIIDGMLDKLGVLDHPRIMTPIKLRNRLLTGSVPHPKQLMFDEGHHHNAESWQQLDLLTGLAPSVAYTATPYRGTPRGTRELLERWGEPVWLITYAEAASMGYVSVPSFEMLPLVDDDIVEIRGGEFDVTSVEAATVDRLGDLAEQSLQWRKDGKWDRPTVYAMPSSGACVRLREELARRGMASVVVSAATPKDERRTAFELVELGIMALLHINIVSEGVDLKLRRLVDCAPTLSPVKWVQQLGRITRPTDVPPEYVCTNRNLLRHAYALEGVVPLAAVIEAQTAFPDLKSDRAPIRALGLEAIGRFKPTSVELLSGLKLSLYSVSVPGGLGLVVEFVVLVHPAMAPVWATKVNMRGEDGQRKYGRWARCEAPSDMRGFGSVPPSALSEKQAAWWKRSAARYGLKPDQEVTRKNFQVLPVLADIGMVLT